jgi:hypothetical protein
VRIWYADKFRQFLLPTVDLNSSYMGCHIKSSPAESFMFGRFNAIVGYSWLRHHCSAQHFHPTRHDALNATVLQNIQLRMRWSAPKYPAPDQRLLLCKQEQRISIVSASTWQRQSTAELTRRFVTMSYFSWIHLGVGPRESEECVLPYSDAAFLAPSESEWAASEAELPACEAELAAGEAERAAGEAERRAAAACKEQDILICTSQC